MMLETQRDDIEELNEIQKLKDAEWENDRQNYKRKIYQLDEALKAKSKQLVMCIKNSSTDQNC